MEQHDTLFHNAFFVVSLQLWVEILLLLHHFDRLCTLFCIL